MSRSSGELSNFIGGALPESGTVTWRQILDALLTQEAQLSSVGGGLSGDDAPREAAVMVMDVALRQGEKAEIHVRDSDDPEGLAERFVAMHGMHQTLVAPLSEQVRKTLVQVCQEEIRLLRTERDTAQSQLKSVEELLLDSESGSDGAYGNADTSATVNQLRK